MVGESHRVGCELRCRGKGRRVRVGDGNEPRVTESREDGEVDQAAETTTANQRGTYGGGHGRRHLQKTDRASGAE